MSEISKAKTGAVLFILWGVLHVIGGAMILYALGGGPEKAYAMYAQSAGSYPPLAGAALGYMAWLIVLIGALVAMVGAAANWRNSAPGLALNTIIVALTEGGLAYFLILPGYLAWVEALPGLLLFVLAVTIGGMACRKTDHVSGNNGLARS